MATAPSTLTRQQFGKALRERFLGEAAKFMVEVAAAVQTRLTELIDEPGNARETQMRRDIWESYKRARPLWIDLTVKKWRECLMPVQDKPQAGSPDAASLELVGTEVVENKILASRLVLAVNEKVLPELEDLRIRIKVLENLEELDGRDLFRPEVLVLLMVEQWAQSGMPGEAWALVNASVQGVLIQHLKVAYKNVNDTLISKGVLPQITLNDRVKTPVRSAGGITRTRSAVAAPGQTPGQMPVPGEAQESAMGDLGPGGGTGFSHSQMPPDQRGGGAGGGGFFGGRLGWGARAPAQSPISTGSAPISAGGPVGTPGSGPSQPFWGQSGASSAQHGLGGTSEETRMMTSATPLARARSRAQGVLGQIRRIFINRAGSDFVGTAHENPSPALVQAISPQAMAVSYAAGGTMYEDYSPAGVARVADDLRVKSTELKKKAETKGEKATIEIVALMFQAILAEERIPPGIRVWFARLQMPVLRVALEDPDFFGSTDHPARALIDRMGSCVMGFDATGVQGAAMEAEVKRVVQVIEQYPETGKKVYQIVYDEFQKFLSKFLTEKGTTQKVVSVAQQVEQKETLAIQYTIEMRNMLKDMPVRDEIRDYLFKVWAEVLAVCALRKGAKHADTQTLKKCATDLVWAASAKPNRVDRARVIQDLPNLLLRLRSGMTLLAMAPSEQEAHVKKISDTLADAFMSKTQAIPQAKIDAMAQRLAALEDFVSEDGMGDLPLDSESLEMMLGIDASAIEVVVGGGSKPTAAMLAWAAELQLGAWFTLDHNNQITQVQLAWRSERKHLNLFASTAGKSFLLQGGRLAAYLQAGLLLPQEEEALTVRATRTALAKLEANPERLLA